MSQLGGEAEVDTGCTGSPSSDAPLRVYFARAIDGEHKSSGQTLASTVAQELEAIGLLMVDPTTNEPLQSSTELDIQLRYRAIVDHDLSVLRTCHAVLMDLSIPERSYIGCICEMTYAYLWQIPCIVYLGGIDKDRPWLHYHATGIFRLRSEAIAYLKTLLHK
jgi:hypothetical protein